MLFDLLKWKQPHLYLSMEGEGDGGGGGGDDLGWRASLPEDLRENETLAQFKDEGEMVQMPVNVAKSYVHARGMIGADTFKMPKTAEEWSETYDKLGRPEKAELYVLPTSEKMHEDLKDTTIKDAEWFRGEAHKLGLSDNQASKLFLRFTERMSDTYNQTLKDKEDAALNTEIQMRTEFGTVFDGKKVLSERALQNLGGERLTQAWKEAGLDANPEFVRFKFKLGEMMAEDLGLDKATGELITSPESVQDQIQAHMNNPAYFDPTHPEHRQLVDKVKHLMEQLHGNKPIPATIHSGALSA